MRPRTVFKGAFKRFDIYSFNIFQQNLTFEDVEAILQILVVVSALIMTFVVSFMVGIQRSDLEAGDRLWINHKNMTEKPWLLTIDQHGLWHTTSDPFTWGRDGGFVSHVIAYRVVHSMGLLVAVVFLVTISYLSLHISRAREDPEHLQRWLMIGQVVIVASSVMFVAALWFAISAIGNIMGILYPPILMHPTYSDMQSFIAEDGSAGNFAIEPLAQEGLRLYCICSISAGFALAASSLGGGRRGSAAVVRAVLPGARDGGASAVAEGGCATRKGGAAAGLAGAGAGALSADCAARGRAVARKVG